MNETCIFTPISDNGPGVYLLTDEQGIFEFELVAEDGTCLKKESATSLSAALVACSNIIRDLEPQHGHFTVLS